MYTEQINKIKQEIISKIIEKLYMYELDEVFWSELNTAEDIVIFENKLDADCNLLLESIKLDSQLLLCGYSKATEEGEILKAEDMNVDVLAKILDTLCEHADRLSELAEENEDDSKAEKHKYVFRFHWRQWVDIVVTAENEEEAAELATDKYNEGDYNAQDADFENTHMENVTEEYKSNEIPF